MPKPPPSQPSIKLAMSIPHRGERREYTNRYFFSGGDITHAQFLVLAGLLRDEQELICTTDVIIDEAILYNAGSDVPVDSTVINVHGTLATTGRQFATSESCILARFSTDQRTSKNHPIYLFKYWKNALFDTGGDGDHVASLQLTRAQSFASDLVTGLNDGSTVRHLTGPYGAVALGQVVSQFIHHRDFPT